jgi:hypothetical protein
MVSFQSASSSDYDPWFNSRLKQQIFSFSETLRVALGPPRILFNTPGVPFLALKRPGRECHSSSECGVENKNEWRCSSATSVRFHGVCRDILSLPLSVRTISTYISVLDFFCSCHFVKLTLHALTC